MKKRKDVVETVESFYKNAPRLSPQLREPLLALLPLGIFVIGILYFVGNSSYSFGIFSSIAGAMFLVGSILLYKKQKTGWILTFWAALVGLLPTLLSFHIRGLLQSVILTAILYYILFEVKSEYK